MPRTDSQRKWTDDYDRLHTDPLPSFLLGDHEIDPPAPKPFRRPTRLELLAADWDMYLLSALVAGIVVAGGAFVWWMS